MNNKKATKRALLTSVMALVMCVVMLVGTTFAWFTDTASTGVNKIQAGNLDIELEMQVTENGETKWVKAEGETLQFKKAAGHESEEVLWEPGCRYELPALLDSTLPKALPVQACITYLSPDLLQRPLAMAMFGVILMLSVLMAALYSIGIRRLIKRLGGEA